MKKLFLYFLLALTLIAAKAMPGEGPIRLTIGESKLINVESAKKVAVGNPAVADVTSVSDQEILISAKSIGSTNLIFIAPDGDKISRTILVSSHNLRKSMVEMGVEIMEIDSQSALKAGLSWGSITSAPVSSSSGSTTSTSSSAESITSNNVAIAENSPPSLAAFGTFARQSLAASVQLLISRGKAKILSKPKLLAVSGEEASFLAGGEIPYIVETKIGSATVEWKPYGVKLNIKPSIEADGNISANLRAEVSGIDLENGLAMNGTTVPALRTRWAETSVYMKSGSTLVIAGLIDEQSQKLTSGIPILSDIPVLGELFRYTDLQKTQTELVIFVTPTMVGGEEN